METAAMKVHWSKSMKVSAGKQLGAQKSWLFIVFVDQHDCHDVKWKQCVEIIFSLTEIQQFS